MSQTGLFGRKSAESEPAAGSVPRQPLGAAGGERLPAPVRERRPGLAVLCVVLLLGGGLGTTLLVRDAGQKVSAVKVVQRVAPGQHIPSAAITEVLVAKGSDLSYVPWGQRGLLASKYFTANEIPPGTLLTGQMLTSDTGVASDQAVVGLSAKPGLFPPGLREGDKVQVWWVGRDATKSSSAGSTATPTAGGVQLTSAKVRQIFKQDAGSASSNLSLSLLVPGDKAGSVAQAAATGDVALVLLPADAQ